jgi:hypothetical protein
LTVAGCLVASAFIRHLLSPNMAHCRLMGIYVVSGLPQRRLGFVGNSVCRTMILATITMQFGVGQHAKQCLLMGNYAASNHTKATLNCSVTLV